MLGIERKGWNGIGSVGAVRGGVIGRIVVSKLKKTGIELGGACGQKDIDAFATFPRGGGGGYGFVVVDVVVHGGVNGVVSGVGCGYDGLQGFAVAVVARPRRGRWRGTPIGMPRSRV